MIGAISFRLCKSCKKGVGELFQRCDLLEIAGNSFTSECHMFQSAGNSFTSMCDMFQSAGNAVKRATEALVQSAHQAKRYQEEEESVTINQRMVGGIAQVRNETRWDDIDTSITLTIKLNMNRFNLKHCWCSFVGSYVVVKFLL